MWLSNKFQAFFFAFDFFSFRIIKAHKKSEVLISLTDWKNNCDGTINYLEHVEVSVNLTYTLRGELLIKLTSPQGTVSKLTHYREADAAFGAKDLNWVLMTLHHWGENAKGVWKLSLESSHPEHYNTGYRNRFKKLGSDLILPLPTFSY